MTETRNDGTTPLEWSTIEARGDDALTFLQGQISQDLTQIHDVGAWALLLAPDSVVLTACFVAKASDGYDLTLPAALADAGLTRLKRFLLRTKCTLEVKESTPGPFATEKDRIDARWPGVNEFAKGLTPHSFGQSFVKSTISFDKGCFTGQELVGRLDARGSSVPWRLVQLHGASVDALSEVLKSKGPEGPQGVTSSYSLGESVVGLGVAHRTLFAALEELNPPGVSVNEVD